MLTVTDLFCGGGGSTVGASLVPGIKVTMAANHWQTAIEVHQENHPDTEHDCADASQVDPRRYPHTDLLWASPSCTKHSIARGEKYGSESEADAGERSRATMWDVQRFAEVHRYRFIWVENVVEVRKWLGFAGWLKSMDDTGYCVHEAYLNAAHANRAGPGAHQWRDRWFALMHPKGTRCPDVDAWIAPRAQCPACGPTTGRQSWKPGRSAGKYRTQYTYRCRICAAPVAPYVRPSRSIIDWEREAPTIGSRTRPLADKTLRRIQVGLRRYRTALIPVEGRDGKRPLPPSGPLRTVTTRNETGLLVPAGGTWNEDAYPANRPVRTVTTRETTALVVPPFIAELRGGHSDTRPVTEPLSTVCASGNHHGLVVPYHSRTRARPTSEPLMTVTTVDRAGIIPAPAPDINDCGFRMLQPYEYARAQAFPDEYDWMEDRISKRLRVRMIGNAVPPCMARDLVACGVESIT